MEKFNLPRSAYQLKALLSVLLLGIFFYSESKVNKIGNFFYHKGQLCDRLVCYFDELPPLEQAEQKKEAQEKLTSLRIFLPDVACMDTKLMDTLQKLSPANAPGRFYGISFKRMEQPVKGMELLITYDPEKISYQYETFTSIKGQAALALNFYFKQNLDSIRFKTEGLLRYASIEPFTVMLDSGHGGSDFGAVGYNGIQEKIVVKAVADKAAQLLEKNGFRVVKSRVGDENVAIDQRTSLANRLNVDIVISIHANSAISAQVKGIETYYLSSRSLQPRVQFVSGWTGQQFMQFFETARDQQAEKLAYSVHDALVARATTYTRDVTDRKVRQKIAQMMFGAEQPAILVELGFVSNQQEAVRLADASYQTILAHGICDGVMRYFKQIKEMNQKRSSSLVSFFLPQPFFLC